MVVQLPVSFSCKFQCINVYSILTFCIEFFNESVAYIIRGDLKHVINTFHHTEIHDQKTWVLTNTWWTFELKTHKGYPESITNLPMKLNDH